MIFEEDLYEGDPRNLGKTLWRVRIDFGKNMPGNESQTAADALEEIAVSIFQHNLESADGDRWEVEMMTLGEPDKADIAQRLSTIGLHLSTDKIIAEPVEQKDWLSHVHDNFPPVVIGNFFVYGSHYAGDIPANLIPLKIDAATAFGSGEHETTRGCLEIMQELAAHNNGSRSESRHRSARGAQQPVANRCPDRRQSAAERFCARFRNDLRLAASENE